MEEEEPTVLEKATFYQRALSSLIDHIVFVFLPLVLLQIYSPSFLKSTLTLPAFLPAQAIYIYYSILFFGISAFISLPFYYLYSATVGKKLVGLRLVDHEGKKPNLIQIMVREFFAKQLSFYLLLIGYLLCFIRKDGQALHDLIVQTTVVQADNNTQLKTSKQKIRTIRFAGLVISLSALYFISYTASKAINASFRPESSEGGSSAGGSSAGEYFADIYFPHKPIAPKPSKCMTHYSCLKALQDAQFNLDRLESLHLKSEIMLQLIITSHPEVMNTYNQHSEITSEFLQDFFSRHPMGAIYFTKKAANEIRLKKIIEENEAKFTLDNIAHEYIRIIEEEKLKNKKPHYHYAVHPYLKNSRAFLEYLFIQDCEVSKNITSIPSDTFSSANIELSLKLYNENKNLFPWKCLSPILKSDEGFTRSLILKEPQKIFEIENAEELELLKKDPEIYKVYINQNVKIALRRIENELFGPHYVSSHNRVLIPDDVYQSSLFQESLLNDYPDAIKRFPHGQSFKIELINTFLESSYRPMRYFNSSHPQFESIRKKYFEIEDSLDQQKIKNLAILKAVAKLKEIELSRSLDTVKFRQAVSIIDEEILNDPLFFEQALMSIHIMNYFFDALPINYNIRKPFKEWLLKKNSEYNSPGHSATIRLPDALKDDKEFMKKFNNRHEKDK